MALIGLVTTALGAAPANDNFASASVISVGFNDWGTVTGTNAGATFEPGEPAHAGTPAVNSVWYSWTAPKDGTIYLDAFNSSFTARLAIYNGTTLSNLSVVAASDFNAPSASVPGTANGNLGGVRFRASAGTTYYIAVDTRAGTAGPFVLNWAYHSSGLFRFSSAAYTCAETENQINGNSGDVAAHSVLGVVITITRIFGSDGRVAVNYATADDTALAGVDYTAILNGQLVFENQEMSRSFVVPIRSDGGRPGLNRDFFVNLTAVALNNEFSNLVNPPRLDTAMTNSTVNILDVNVDPNDPSSQVPDDPPSAVVNFQKSAYRVSEIGGTATIWVYRYGTNVATKKIAYSIDCTAPWQNLTNWDTFPLQAGSDYATPGVDSNRNLSLFRLPMMTWWSSTRISASRSMCRRVNSAAPPTRMRGRATLAKRRSRYSSMTTRRARWILFLIRTLPRPRARRTTRTPAPMIQYSVWRYRRMIGR
jgi:hypothetical protein